jgi:arylformamidase
MSEHPTPREPDIASYHTVRFADQFEVDWAAFYQEADERSARIRDKYRHQSHVMYGRDPHQLLNVLLPEETPDRAPVFVFAHGGGFREGHPDHYDFLAEPFLTKGAIHIGVGYRLLPEASMAEAVDDVAQAVRWIAENVTSMGGDAQRIHLGGHSAGAIITAVLAARNDWQRGLGLPLDVIKGAACISGAYDLEARAKSFGLELERARELDPVRNIQRAPAHIVVAYGLDEVKPKGTDLRSLARSSAELINAMRRADAHTDLIAVDGADHRDTVRLLGDLHSPIHQGVDGMIWPGSRP